MNKELAEYLINYSLNTGADFSEIYYEKIENSSIKLIDKRIDNVSSEFTEGVGIRIALKDNIYYAHTNIITKENLVNLIDELKSNINETIKMGNIKLKQVNHLFEIEDITDSEKKETLYKVDELARKENKLVSEVSSSINTSHKIVIIASSKGKYVIDERNYNNFIINVVVSNSKERAQGNKHYRFFDGSLFIKSIDLSKDVKTIVDSAVKKLDAIYIKGGHMPVVLGPGFGAVIFHEACGHAMEATSVAKGLSVLCGKLGTKIASDKVTIIDDGTIDRLWGTTYYDDEGNKTKKNLLIEKGILKSYLVDELNARIMKHKINGCARRQDYSYAPTSRMNNTYLAPGTDTFDEMIKSIEYGLYAKEMGGGSVDPVTGDFNFVVNEGYIIRDGKICEIVKMATLIGNTLEILNNVEMVSDDIEYDGGYCGSESGLIPVTIGEPSIKISDILVGGGTND